MTIVYGLIITFLGFVVFLYTVSNILMTVFFTLPLTRRLEEISYLRINNIASSYIIAMLMQMVVLVIYSALMYVYLDSYLVYLVVGYIVAFLVILMNRHRCRLDLVNFVGYFEANKEYFWEELVAKYEEDRDNIFKAIQYQMNKKRNE